MYEIRDKDGKVIAQAYEILGPVEVKLAPGFRPGEQGNLTIEEFESELRRDLSDFLLPNHPIIFLREHTPEN
jgi:hypothetical protein